MQELLQYTMHQHLGEAEPVQAEATEDFGEWAALDNALPNRDALQLSSPQNRSPSKPDASSDNDSPRPI